DQVAFAFLFSSDDDWTYGCVHNWLTPPDRLQGLCIRRREQRERDVTRQGMCGRPLCDLYAGCGFSQREKRITLRWKQKRGVGRRKRFRRSQMKQNECKLRSLRRGVILR